VSDVSFSEAFLGRFAEAVAARLTATASDRSPWMTVTEAAEYTRLSKSLLSKRIEADTIPHRKVGRRRILHREELDRWLDTHRRGVLQ
jgi:excisionase family DNA binding protein